MILQFKGKYSFLSNMYSCSILFNGILFPSAEHAFQCSKCTNIEDFNKILNCKSSKLAKRLGRQIKLRSDWELIKDKIMFEIVKAKFNQNYNLGKKLIKTYPKILIEGNIWKDTYWGVDLNKPGDKYKYGYYGFNKLGEILMNVRDILKTKYDK